MPSARALNLERRAPTGRRIPARGGPGAPPGFARDAGRSYGDPLTGNALVHAENLDAMRRLARAGFEARFRCVYLDPPFNSGRRFDEYDDALSPEAWGSMMRERIDAARALLADDGALCVEIDDTELGPLQCILDEAMGRAQRVSTVTVVRSAATGHKAVNRGPVNVTDFLLVYARDRARWRCNALVRQRAGYDDAYGTWLDNPGDPPERWRFAPLVAQARRALGAGATRARRGRALGRRPRGARRALRAAPLRGGEPRGAGPHRPLAP